MVMLAEPSKLALPVRSPLRAMFLAVTNFVAEYTCMFANDLATVPIVMLTPLFVLLKAVNMPLRWTLSNLSALEIVLLLM